MKLVSPMVLMTLVSFGVSRGQEKITFAEHIAPIIFNHCAPCHHPGTAAPFSLMSYDDVVKRTRMIEFVTQSRYMPPWKADPFYRSFANEKLLTEQQLSLIRGWIAQKAPMGKKRRLPPSPNYSKSFFSGEPDVVLSVQKPFTIKGDGKENFIFFVIPFEFDQDHRVESIEYTSTNYKIVHHANFGIYEVDPSISIRGDSVGVNSGELSQYANRYTELTKNVVYYNGWVPGTTPVRFPQGVGFKMPRRGVVILTNHYAPSPVDVTEMTSLNFFFKGASVDREIKTLSIGSGSVGEIYPPLILFPNEINAFKIQMEVVEPLSLLYVWPHMHLLGKSFKAYYVTSERDTVPLVRINKWEFNWQEAYRFRKLMKLPAGSVLTIEGEYDNTANNPSNPFSPPQLIVSDGLMGTKNEMLSLILVYLNYQDGDENMEL